MVAAVCAHAAAAIGTTMAVVVSTVAGVKTALLAAMKQCWTWASFGALCQRVRCRLCFEEVPECKVPLCREATPAGVAW
jgi:hypothetical protein